MDFGEFVGVAGDEVEIFWWHFSDFLGFSFLVGGGGTPFFGVLLEGMRFFVMQVGGCVEEEGFGR